MLNWVRIKNLALVEEADVEFCDGFNVLTGETGAGKSVIIGTMGLLLGERADKGMIRTGESRCEICASITVKDDLFPYVSEILKTSGVPCEENELVVRRVITNSSTRNFINDTPTTLQTLRSIGEQLIDIHGANEHQSLVRQGRQLELLDRFGSCAALQKKCRDVYELIKDVHRRRQILDDQMVSSVEAGHLRMIIEEIEAANPQENEDHELSASYSRAANSKDVLEVAGRSVAMLSDGESSVVDALSAVHRELSALCKIDADRAESLLEQCDELVDAARELSFDIEKYASSVDVDEQTFYEMESRLGVLQTLKRRYGPYLENVFDTLKDARIRINQFDNAEDMRRALDDEEASLVTDLNDAANMLSAQRRKAAKKFSTKVVNELKILGFLQSVLSVEFTSTDSGPNGCDKIDFYFSANPGERPQPLRNIASSGEMSRVMLALKTVLAENDSVPILVFDEIDVNIGGETAIKVGEGLKKLADSHQILCISHLAQVASKADLHYLVAKSVADGRTSTDIRKLDDDGRADEVSRMLGGGNAARAHALELLG